MTTHINNPEQFAALVIGKSEECKVVYYALYKIASSFTNNESNCAPSMHKSGALKFALVLSRQDTESLDTLTSSVSLYDLAAILNKLQQDVKKHGWSMEISLRVVNAEDDEWDVPIGRGVIRGWTFIPSL